MQNSSYPEGTNVAEWTVTALSAAIRGAIEDSFGRVRVRGEIGRVSRPASGHVYLDLKDEGSVLAAVIWRSQASRLTVEPREGLEVVATGRITTYGRQSKYQMLIEQLRPAGEGAILAAIEQLRRRLESEGLFDTGRKRPLPKLPEAIGVITSPTGSVIRDILHRIGDRFPIRVIIWPAAVQGAACPGEVAAALDGFNALPDGGPVPRPNVIIVARGGGSVEDLSGFSDEVVVRAVAASEIPVISAIGHETDTALCDHAADVRAPTPTAAAELAVPESVQLRARILALDGRRGLAAARQLENLRLRLGARSASLPRAETLLAQSTQRLDGAGVGLASASRGRMEQNRARLGLLDVRLHPAVLRRRALQADSVLKRACRDLQRTLRGRIAVKQGRVDAVAPRFSARLLARELGAARTRLALASRRLRRSAGSEITRRAAGAFERAAERLQPEHLEREVARAEDRLSSRIRLLETLSYRNTLSRGFAVVRHRRSRALLTDPSGVTRGTPLEIEFREERTLTAIADPEDGTRDRRVGTLAP